MYSGTSLFRTPLGLQKVSSIKRYILISEVDLYIFITIGIRASVHNIKCVFISGVSTVRGSTYHQKHHGLDTCTAEDQHVHTCIHMGYSPVTGSQDKVIGIFWDDS